MMDGLLIGLMAATLACVAGGAVALARLNRRVKRLIKTGEMGMQNLQALIDQVSISVDAETSAAHALTDLLARYEASRVDPAAVQQLVDKLKVSSEALTAAVASVAAPAAPAPAAPTA